MEKLNEPVHTPVTTRTSAIACIIAAMPEEMAPALEILRGAGYSLQPIIPAPDGISPSPAPLKSLTLAYPPSPAQAPNLAQPANQPATPLILAVTGIGFAATASTLGWLLAQYDFAALVSIGSAGGLSTAAKVRHVVFGTRYRNGGADGTAFGYVRGQVPGQPEYFTADLALLSAATTVALDNDEIEIYPAEMISSDTFVTSANVGDMREAFAKAATADMESYAAASVAHQFGVPFISIRAISDLCAPPPANPDASPEAEQAASQAEVFHAELSQVAPLAAITAIATLTAARLL